MNKTKEPVPPLAVRSNVEVTGAARLLSHSVRVDCRVRALVASLCR